MESFLYTAAAALAIAVFSGFYGQKNGYSFWRQFITGFIASLGILLLCVKLIQDYL